MPTDVDRRGTVPHMADCTVRDARRAWADAGFRPQALQIQDERGAPVTIRPADEAQVLVRVQNPDALTKLDKIDGAGILIVLPPRA